MYNNKIVKLIPLGMMFLIFLSCQTTNYSVPTSEREAITKENYIIGPEDRLQIYVWKQPSISVTVPVRSDGKISVPLINDIQAAGLTPHQLKDSITKKLTKFIEAPTVSVIVEAINSLKITISGNVNSPGVYKLSSAISFLSAMSLAGGLTEYGDPKRIKIIRKENGVEKIYQVNYDAILNVEDIKQNVLIYPGDSIIVP